MATITFGDGTNSGYAEADTNGGASTTVTKALGWAQAQGDLIVVSVSFAVAVAPIQAGYPQDTSGNTYVQIGTNQTDPGSNFTVAMFACLNAKAAAASANSVTVKVAAAGVAGDLLIEVFGATAPGYFWQKDQFSHNSGNGTTMTPGAVTTTTANEFLCAFVVAGSAVTGSPGAPWNNQTVDPNGGQASYYIATSIQTSVNPSYTQATQVWVVQIATFSLVGFDVSLKTNQRAPGFPRNAPIPGISLLGKGILVPKTPSGVSNTNLFPSGFTDPDVALGSVSVSVVNPGYFLPAQQRAPGFPMQAPIPGIVLLGSDVLIPVSTTIQVTNLYPLGIDTLEAWGALSMSVTVYPAGIDNGNFNGSSGSAPNVAGAGLGGGEAFGAEGVAAAVLPGGIISSEAGGSFGGAPNVAGSGMAGGDTFGAEGFAANVAGAAINTFEGSGASGMSANVLPAGIDSKETLGAEAANTNLALTGIKTEEAEGSMTSAVVFAVFPSGAETQESFGAAVIAFVNAILKNVFFDRRSPRAGGGRRGRG